MAKDRTVKADEPEPAARESAPRISLPLNEAGAIDWGKMRESTRAGILDKLRNDPALRQAGGAPAPAPPDGDVFSEPMAGMLFDVLGQVEVSIAMSAFRCDRQTASVMLYTDPEKAMLTGPLTKVLNKYGSKWLTKYGDEFVLASLLVAVNAPKVMALQELRATPAHARVQESQVLGAPGGAARPWPAAVPAPDAQETSGVKRENAQ